MVDCFLVCVSVVYCDLLLPEVEGSTTGRHKDVSVLRKMANTPESGALVGLVGGWVGGGIGREE